MLYYLVECPHRPSMDLFADPLKRDKLSPFVQLLWEKGTAYEQEVVAGLEIPFLDLTPYSLEEKEINDLITQILCYVPVPYKCNYYFMNYDDCL